MCSRIGTPRTLSIGFGSSLVSFFMRVPLPAARITAFTCSICRKPNCLTSTIFGCYQCPATPLRVVSGMRCPKCGCLDDKVIDSRSSREGGTIRRRRECLKCGFRFTTYEEVEKPATLMVLKRDGRHEEFSREKLLAALQRACQKRPVSLETIQEIAERVYNELIATHEREVSYREIGERV